MRTMILALVASAILGVATSAVAETPYLVEDINPFLEDKGSLPDILGVHQGAAFFAADDGISGRELWRTDGTDAGTWQVDDLCPGECDSNPATPLLSTPAGFFFLASSGGARQLWITRGDPVSTVQLTEGIDYLDLSSVRFRPVWDDRRNLLFFVGWDSQGVEIWRSDGTPAGTWRMTDINPQLHGYPPSYLTLFAGQVFFLADDDRRGPALWTTDGTAQGTRLVKSFGIPSGGPAPQGLRAAGGMLVLTAPRSSQTFWLWRSDGTTRGTIPLAALGARGKAVSIHSSLIVGSRLFFTTRGVPNAPSALWVTDGTAAGTRKLGSFSPESVRLPGFAFGSRIVFPAADAEHGSELWITDGTPAGTRLLKDFCPGSCSSSAAPLVVHRNRLVVSASAPGLGIELWTTDGTAAGTRLLRDLCSGTCDASPWVLGVRNGRLLFSARNGDNHEEIWSSDGTSPGTLQVSRLGPEGSVRRGGAYAWSAALSTGFLFLAADSIHGEEIWQTDGTPPGTQLVRDIAVLNDSGSDPQGFMQRGNELFFFAHDGLHGYELWKSDGIGEGTRLVAELWPGDGPIFGPEPPVLSVEAGGLLFVQVFGQVWRTDGTEAGTLRLTQGLRLWDELAAVGNLVFFAGAPEGIEDELWVSDGTIEGTRRLAELFDQPEFFTPFRGRLYFIADDQLWSSNGTPEGTAPLAMPEPLRHLDNLTAHKGFLYFFAYANSHGSEVWRTDGTTDGTTLAVEISPGWGNLVPTGMVSTGEKLFFSGVSPDQEGVWVSDGTQAGTSWLGRHHLQDNASVTVFRGVLYSSTIAYAWRSDGTVAGTGPLALEVDGLPVHGPLVVFGDRLYSSTGGSLIETDGTLAGTRVIRAASPAWFIPADAKPLPTGPRLFFPAFDRTRGKELWALGAR